MALPSDGCTNISGEEVCCCSGSLCNTMPMEPVSGGEGGGGGTSERSGGMSQGSGGMNSGNSDWSGGKTPSYYSGPNMVRSSSKT